MVLGNVLMDMFQGDEEPKVAEAAHEPAAPESHQPFAAESPAPEEDYFADSGDSGDFFGGDDEDFV